MEKLSIEQSNKEYSKLCLKPITSAIRDMICMETQLGGATNHFSGKDNGLALSHIVQVMRFDSCHSMYYCN